MKYRIEVYYVDNTSTMITTESKEQYKELLYAFQDANWKKPIVLNETIINLPNVTRISFKEPIE